VYQKSHILDISLHLFVFLRCAWTSLKTSS